MLLIEQSATIRVMVSLSLMVLRYSGTTTGSRRGYDTRQAPLVKSLLWHPNRSVI
jgi:hypothetical protein